jgi:hypothetical protein|nr:MAG TPA: hypothetical protein [Caudoviricetes sp.]
MKKPRFYYKTPSDSETGQMLTEFFDRCKAAEDQACQWAKQQGASHYYESPNGMAGGVSGVEFGCASRKEGWEKITLRDGNAMFVPVEGSSLAQQMSALPVVNEMDLVRIFRFLPSSNGGDSMLSFTFGDKTPVMFLHQGFWYADMPYESGREDVIAVGEKEFYRKKYAAINMQSF